MAATNFNTENNTYRKLMGNGLTYRIPRFQRDYSWTEDEWEDLWLDLCGTLQPDGEPAHYMGYLVLQSNDEKFFDVIDGQQRLTTLNLIVLSVLKILKTLVESGQDSENNQRRLDQIRQTYIGYLDPVTLVSRSKLTLNRNNDHYFQTYIVPLGNLPVRGFRASEHLLRKSYEWFQKRVGDYAREKGGDEGVALAQLVENMSDRLFFTVINVTDELNAYKVFETLNARGVRLSPTDLLKNYLFSVLHRETEHQHEMKVLEDRWEALVGRLGGENFTDFLRVHWNSRRSFVRETELFKTIRAQVRDRAQVFTLLNGLEEDLDTFLALAQPEASNWSVECKKSAVTLRMFSVKQPYALLLAARRKFSGDDFHALLRACVAISFRYNVIGSQPTNEQERVYHSVAQKISQDAVKTIGEALPLMSSIYPNDRAFRADFAEKSIKTASSRNARIVRYVLHAIEKQASGQDFDPESDTLTIEHILPQNPGEGWDSFSENEIEAMLYRLGNMTLLTKAENKTIGNAAFAVKKPVYAQSRFLTTKTIAEENADWNPNRLAARQTAMANQATAIWRIAQLS